MFKDISEDLKELEIIYWSYPVKKADNKNISTIDIKNGILSFRIILLAIPGSRAS